MANLELRRSRVHPHLQEYDSSDTYSSSLGVYRSDWTPKPAVDIIEEITEQNQAFIAAEEAQSAAAAAAD
jgi:hypothetical protein